MSATGSAWEQLKRCRPSLLPAIDFEYCTIRQQSWMVLRNRASGDHLRINESAALLVQQLDGTQTLAQLYEAEQALFGTPDNLLDLLTPMLATGMLTLGTADETERLLRQHQIQQKRHKFVRYANPLALRFPLIDPDAWLERLIRYTGKWWSRQLLMVLTALVLIGVIVASMNLSVLSDAFKRVTASPVHWWLYALLYPALKAVHEFAHAIAVKKLGGSVHESGITLLVLMPIPYVDASDAWLFPNKKHRILVGMAGMLAECSLAAIGLFIFLLVQPGVLQELGFAMFLLGSVATIMFNANPLLKFDGYYILQDWLEIPNLASRARHFCLYCLKKSVLRLKNVKEPSLVAGERVWLLVYGVLAVAYRFFITIVIALFLASQYFLFGTMLAGFALYQLIVKPLLQLVQYLRESVELSGQRTRAVVSSAMMTAITTLMVLLLPLPSSTRAEGVVWVPNQAQVFALESGVVSSLTVAPGTLVKKGQLLMQLRAPELQKKLQVVDSQLTALTVQHRALEQRDKVAAQTLAADMQSLEAEKALIQSQTNQLDIRAAMDGQFVLDKNGVLLGRHVRRGELLAYIVNKQELTVKAVLSQKRIERVQDGVVDVTVRLADRFKTAMPARLTRQTPAASNDLPSPALAYDGKSGIAVASQNEEQLKTLEGVFHIELALPQLEDIAGIGGRAYVTLQHEPESLGRRWWRSTRQLLLKRLTV